MYLVEPAEGTFTKQELARLRAYRAAVAAGFYSDWDGCTPTAEEYPLPGEVAPRESAVADEPEG
jgi:hypothetical protein